MGIKFPDQHSLPTCNAFVVIYIITLLQTYKLSGSPLSFQDTDELNLILFYPLKKKSVGQEGGMERRRGEGEEFSL